ncbi:MAG: hypothetical protein IJI66_04035 [Erysipelotrichaceae bacterium]|nr:hypothetical protein [Erysipelotrichaceae bacterium]MBR0418318.1 hypothetical protein [Erysipelotrichaceae bacterium]
MAEKKKKTYVAASEETKEAAKQIRKQAKPVGNASGKRVGAVVCWIIALIFEVCALMVFLGKLDLKFMPQLYQLIAFLVLDLIFVIIGSQLWKQANHIDPVSEENAVKFWLWNNMGVIVASVAFVPFAILALTDKNADKKTKTIATVAAVICLLIGGVASYDFNPVSSEQKAAAVNALGSETVYWTTFGKVYHTHDDCSHLNQSETLTYGTVEEAIAANRVRLCKTCANRDNISGVATEN